MEQPTQSHKRRRLGETPIHTTKNHAKQPHKCICGDIVVTPQRLLSPGYVHFDSDGMIILISETPPASFQDFETAPILIPGHVDIHNHGVGGADDVVDYWNVPSYTLSRLARVGTTSVIATLVFPDNQHERSKTTCDALSACVNQDGHGCVVRGIHAEGPVVATLGGLPDSSRQAAGSVEEFECLLNDIGEHLKIMTVAPSCDVQQNYARLQMLSKRNVKISLGHDKNCTEADIVGALRAVGPQHRCHMTHVFNVQQFHHRNSGLANFALVSEFPQLAAFQDLTPPTVEVIGDFQHVSPMALRALLGARGVNDICCITDAIAESIPGKRIKYSSDRLAEVSEDGQTVNIAGTTTLCGSCTSLHDTFRRLVDVLKVTMLEAVHVCSTTPSRIVGIDNEVGSLEIGKRGDLLMLDKDLNLLQTVIGGRTVWDCDAPMVLST